MLKGILDEKTGHEWDKVNLVTKIDRDGMYDLWQCVHCKKKFKRRGVSWHPPQEPCKKNSRPTQGAVDAALPSCPMCGSTDPEHFHVKRTWLNPAAPLT